MTVAISPVLFIIFNRLEPAMAVLEQIALAKPPRLYIAADGARPGKSGEVERTTEVRDAVLGRIDWPCEVRTQFQSANLGCRRGVIAAIDWFFDNEPEGIILEDDVVPAPEFFRFATEMLDRYRDQPRIMMVCGTNQFGTGVKSGQYFYSAFGSIWGWATWARAWREYDVTMSGWKNGDLQSRLLTRHSQTPARYLCQVMDNHLRDDVDTWDIQWSYTIHARDALTVIPEANLIRNIGIVGTHSSIETRNHHLGYGSTQPPYRPISNALVEHAAYRDRLASEIFGQALRIAAVSRATRSVGLHAIARATHGALLSMKRRLRGE